MAFSETMSKKKTFSLLGFPTKVRPGFLIFLAILTFLYPFPLGLWVAGAVAIFTVIHELGHALAARRAGCRASISMDFMVAYATYESPHPLSWTKKISIALAGPLLQIGTAVLILAILGINPFSRSDITSSEMIAALWWAGVALGALNLIPLLPLDGGAIVASVAEHLSPERGRNIMLRISVAVTGALAAASVMLGFGGFLPLFLLMLFMQWQALAIPKRVAQLAQDPHFSSGGDAQTDAAIITNLVDQDLLIEALAYARRAYLQCPAFSTASAAARISFRMGDVATGLTWLHAAEASRMTHDDIADVTAQILLYTDDTVVRNELLKRHPQG